MFVDGLCKRIIPCLDVRDGKTVKGIKFQGLRDIGDPVELGLRYEQQGADELTFLDISASNEQRGTVVELVKNVAANLSIPFTVGGGVSSLNTVKRLLSNGADKISVNTAAVKRPQLVEEIASQCGSQCCVVAIDARRRNQGNGYEVLIHGGRESTGKDALDWAIECVERGAGEILLTSWDQDGTREGFDLDLVRLFSDRLAVPIIASGGARDAQSFVDVFRDGHADAALAASIFHDDQYTVGQIKEQLNKAGVRVRLC
jgi:cyclase